MSYEKTNWVTGDIVTADKLNKLEDGVVSAGNSSGLLTYTPDQESETLTLDKTFNEVLAMLESGTLPFLFLDHGIPGAVGGYVLSPTYLLGGNGPFGPSFGVSFPNPASPNTSLDFVAHDPNDPLVCDLNGGGGDEAQ